MMVDVWRVVADEWWVLSYMMVVGGAGVLLVVGNRDDE